MEDLVWGSGNVTMDDNAFNGCSSLRTVTAGTGTTDLDYNNFRNCSSAITWVFGHNENVRGWTIYDSDNVLFGIDSASSAIIGDKISMSTLWVSGADPADDNTGDSSSGFIVPVWMMLFCILIFLGAVTYYFVRHPIMYVIDVIVLILTLVCMFLGV